jgi:hypothetical protein
VISPRKTGTHNKALLAMAILISFGLAGCVDGATQAGSYALADLATELQTLKTSTDQESSTTDSPGNLEERIKDGSVGRVLPRQLDPNSSNLGSSFVAIYDISTSENTVTFHAVLQASGVSGGGWTYKEQLRYLCLTIHARVSPQTPHAAVEDVTCRSDIVDLLRTMTDNRRVSLSELHG